METTFAMRMVALRKERGISQKEAAGALKVSQALLSHYEKGIRECGLAFLGRCADFYGVTVDYLLGLSAQKTPNAAQAGAAPEDALFSAQTLQRAVQWFGKGEKDGIDRLVSILLYQALLVKTAQGEIPKEWLPESEKADSPVLRALLNGMQEKLLQELPAAILAHEKELPQSLFTVAEQVRAMLRENNSLF